MKNKLTCMLLIDDDETVNFLHRSIIEMCDATKKLLIAETGEQALELLKESVQGELEKPNIIFLDLNMPKMDGWAFLEAYKKMQPAEQMPYIVILSASANPDDELRAETMKEIGGFYHKPLTGEMLREITGKYWAAKG